MEITVATEVWIATALLHREKPDRTEFSVREIVDRVARENLSGTLRPGVQIHVSQHCVANKRPNPGRHRMLYATRRGFRRLFKPTDKYHEYRTGGRTAPEPEALPQRYQGLLKWYEEEYCRR